MLAIRSQGILSATAQVEEFSGSWEPGIPQVTESIAAYSPALGKGFPNVTALLWQESFLSEVVTVRLLYPEFNNSVLLGEGFSRERSHPNFTQEIYWEGRIL